MSFLGRIAGLGRALIARGLGGLGGGAPPVVIVPRVGVCMVRSVDVSPIVYRREARSPIFTVASAEAVTAPRLVPDVVRVRRPLPEC